MLIFNWISGKLKNFDSNFCHVDSGHMDSKTPFVYKTVNYSFGTFSKNGVSK